MDESDAGRSNLIALPSRLICQPTTAWDAGYRHASCEALRNKPPTTHSISLVGGKNIFSSLRTAAKASTRAFFVRTCLLSGLSLGPQNVINAVCAHIAALATNVLLYKLRNTLRLIQLGV
jgi:hypothetical protein